MAEIVTLAELKTHLRLTPPSSPLSDDDVDLQQKLDAAHELVLTKVGERVDATAAAAWQLVVLAWDPTTAPESVRVAVLQQAAELYRYRGDDEPNPALGSELAPGVRRLINLWRDPVVS